MSAFNPNTVRTCIFRQGREKNNELEHAACFLLLMLHSPHRGVKMTARNVQLLLIPPHFLDKNAYGCEELCLSTLATHAFVKEASERKTGEWISVR